MGFPSAGPSYGFFSSKLRNVKSSLKAWNKDVFGLIFTQLREAEEEVLEKELLFDLNNSADNRAALLQAQAQHCLHLSRVEAFWQQKSRIKWMKDGNGNSKHFYASVKQSQRRLNIHSIKDVDGTVLDIEADIKRADVSYFNNQLTSEVPLDNVCLDVIPSLVMDEWNTFLIFPHLWRKFEPRFLGEVGTVQALMGLREISLPLVRM